MLVWSWSWSWSWLGPGSGGLDSSQMATFKKFFNVLTNVCFSASVTDKHPTASFCLLLSFSRSPLILVSMDGFREKYLKDHGDHLPVINKLRERKPQLLAPSQTQLSKEYVLISLCYRKTGLHDAIFKTHLSHKDVSKPLQHRDCEFPVISSDSDLSDGPSVFFSNADEDVRNSLAPPVCCWEDNVCFLSAEMHQETFTPNLDLIEKEMFSIETTISG